MSRGKASALLLYFSVEIAKSPEIHTRRVIVLT